MMIGNDKDMILLIRCFTIRFCNFNRFVWELIALKIYKIFDEKLNGKMFMGFKSKETMK